MTSKRKYPPDLQLHRYSVKGRDWKPMVVGVALVVIILAVLYSCTSLAGAQQVDKWDLYRWIWPAPKPASPPVVIQALPVIEHSAPIAPEPDILPQIFVDPPKAAPPPVATPTPIEQPKPSIKSKPERKTVRPRQKTVVEVPTTETMPPCWQIQLYAADKTCEQLKAEGISRGSSPAMRRHAIACLPGKCSK